MPDPRENPLRFVPRTVSDTVDGDNSPQGACSSLANLIWSPDTPNVLECRPANLELSTFPGFTTPGVVSVAMQINNIIYGMIASGSPAGKDRPFAYNTLTNTFETVTGITSANCPITQPTTGAWTPPTMDMVGSRIYVTHPGFTLVSGKVFGYFDISGFTEITTGDITLGSPIVTGNPLISGVGPGYLISGAGIPANTTVLNTSAFNLTTTGNTNTSTSLTSVANTAGLAVGQLVVGNGIPTGTVITAISGSTITLSQATTATATGVSVFFQGATITMSANATANTNNLSITIAGGTLASPLWAAGNTTGALQLLSVPQSVRQFNNRTYFGAGNQLIFTDTLSTNISDAVAVQVFTIGDSTPIVAQCGMPFETTVGGILQALIVYKQYSIYQITGDIVTNDLLINQLSGTVGTDAARSVAQAPAGQYFKASDGIRTINLVGQVSEPNEDLAVPFIYSVNPSRVSASFNSDVYRICVQNGSVIGNPYQDFYYNAKYSAWVGPHSFRVDMAVPFGNDFIVFNNAIPATMWQSFSVQNRSNAGNTFIEDGNQLTWKYTTSPMTDLGNMYTNAAVRSTLDMALPSTGDTFLFQGIDENNGVLSTASITLPLNEGVWDAFNWGDGTLWGAKQFGLLPVTIPWTQPLIFNKLVFNGQGNSSLGLKLGALYTGYEKLRYMKQ